MGKLSTQLFTDIADDASDALKRLELLRSMSSTSRFDGEGALENLRGQTKLFEILMRRAANQCHRKGLNGQASQKSKASVTVSLTIKITDANLLHDVAEIAQNPNYDAKNNPGQVRSVPQDDARGGKVDKRIKTLIDALANGTVISCSGKKPALLSKHKTKQSKHKAKQILGKTRKQKAGR